MAVAEHGTVSKAAAVLNITQPALSRQIGSLEHEFGFALFERSGRRLLLTPRGEQLLGDCRSMLARAASLAERAQALRRGDIKVLKVAGLGADHRGAVSDLSALPCRAHAGRARHDWSRPTPTSISTCSSAATSHFAINVINTMQVDDNRFASYALPPFQMVAACAAIAEDRRLAKRSISASSASCRCCC